MVNASSVNSTAGRRARLDHGRPGGQRPGLVHGQRLDHRQRRPEPPRAAARSPAPAATASAANACYCPSGTAPAVNWGAAATCGAACSGGGYAGKFVLVQASARLHADPLRVRLRAGRADHLQQHGPRPMKTIRALLRCRRGATAVEFGLIAAPLVLMLFGVTETARFYWTTASLQSAAQQTARCMAVPDPACATSGAYSAAQAQAYLVSLASADGVTLTANEITLSNAATCGGASGFSTVSHQLHVPDGGAAGHDVHGRRAYRSSRRPAFPTSPRPVQHGRAGGRSP